MAGGARARVSPDGRTLHHNGDMTSSEPPRDRAWVEVSGTALRRNLDRIAAAAGRGVGVAPMVKADGYGLGVERVVRALRPARPAAWGVATIEEGVALRRLGVAGPVWICAPVPPQALARAVDAGLVPSISDLDSLAVLREIASARARTVPFQIDIDTGMGRSGFPIGAGTDADTVRGELSLAPGAPSAPPADWWPALVRTARESLRLHGIFTHLHSADEPDLAGARHQVRLFDDFVRAARATGRLPADAFIHCASSAGALRLQSETANVVRPGIFLYGASPVARGVSRDPSVPRRRRPRPRPPRPRRTGRRHGRLRSHLPRQCARALGRRRHRVRRRPAARARGRGRLGPRRRAAGARHRTHLHGLHRASHPFGPGSASVRCARRCRYLCRLGWGRGAAAGRRGGGGGDHSLRDPYRTLATAAPVVGPGGRRSIGGAPRNALE